MNLPVRIGMDTSKSVFQLHGVDENEVVVDHHFTVEDRLTGDIQCAGDRGKPLRPVQAVAGVRI
jgi:hypothetical protein